MSCGCDTCSCEDDFESDRVYITLKNDLNSLYLRKEYAEILERLEKEFPIDLANISKLKLSE